MVDCKKVNQKQFQNTKPIWNNAQRVNHQNFAKKTHPCVKKNIVPRAVLMKSGLVSVNTARQVNAAHTKTIVNAARPMSYLSKTAHSTVKRPIHKNTTFKNSNFNQRVNTVKDKNVNTVRPKAVVNAAKPKAVVNAARPKAVVNAVKGNNVNAVKASACWVWKPKNKIQVSDGLGPKENDFITKVQAIHKWIYNLKEMVDMDALSVDLKNIVPKGGLTGLFSKATSNEYELWHRRLGYINFKTMNKLVKGNLVCYEMLADSKLPTTFWAEAVNTACYVQNKVLVTKPHNKTPYELFLGRKPALGFMRPFGCPVTILNTIDHLGKFDSKANEGFFVGYSINSIAFRVFNSGTRIVEENLHVQFIVAVNQSNDSAGTKACDDVGDDEKKVTEELGKEGGDSSKDSECSDQEKEDNVNNTNNVLLLHK
ncbi:ribonuclease H-like domain-containing protein [Tanacetum coccineum]